MASKVVDFRKKIYLGLNLTKDEYQEAMNLKDMNKIGICELCK